MNGDGVDFTRSVYSSWRAFIEFDGGERRKGKKNDLLFLCLFSFYGVFC